MDIWKHGPLAVAILVWCLNLCSSLQKNKDKLKLRQWFQTAPDLTQEMITIIGKIIDDEKELSHLRVKRQLAVNRQTKTDLKSHFLGDFLLHFSVKRALILIHESDSYSGNLFSSL